MTLVRRARTSVSGWLWQRNHLGVHVDHVNDAALDGCDLHLHTEVHRLGWLAVEPVTDLLERAHVTLVGHFDELRRELVKPLVASLAVVLAVDCALDCRSPNLVGLGAGFGGDGSAFRTKRGLEKSLFHVTIILSVLFLGLGLANLILTV